MEKIKFEVDGKEFSVTPQMTYKQAKGMGYRDGDLVLQHGYVSRKVNVGDQFVDEAGGSRRGQLYVLLPNWKSTRYCYRQYLIAPEK